VGPSQKPAAAPSGVTSRPSTTTFAASDRPANAAWRSAFGGWKNSLFGDTKAHGAEGFRFFTQQKAITAPWLDPSHGGINLGFPQT
jgi:hypothetical protein